MAASDVLDPAGVRWSVRRRWYPWRRTMSMREALSSSPDEEQTGDPAPETSEAGNDALPRNWVLKVFFVVLAAIVWVVYGVGKVLLYGAAAALFVIISVAELILLVACTPVALLLRLVGLMQWPVEIGRQGKPFATRRAPDFAAAGTLRDGLVSEIQSGVLPAAQPEPAPAP